MVEPTYQTSVHDSVYDMAFVALNADLCCWYLMMDLSEQDGLEESEADVPLQTLLITNLAKVLCDGSTPMLAKREWVVQLFEHGNVQTEQGSGLGIPVPERSNFRITPLN